MLDSVAAPDIFPSNEEEAAEPLNERINDEDELDQNPDMIPESAEGADDDLGEALPALPPSRWKWSRSLSMGVIADDNINLTSTNKESDLIFAFGANFRLLWGFKKDESYLAIDYSPTMLVFADHSRENAFDQKAGLAAQWRLAKLTLGAQAGLRTLSGGDVDVGDRADRILWQITLQAKYDYSTKTSFEVNLSPNASDYSRYLDSMEWVNSNWVDYQAFPKTRIGAGLTFGYLKPEGGDSQTYQQALVRITNPLTGKTTVNASGGIEYRQLGGSGGTQTTPVFRLGVGYRPFDGTQITVEASRRIYSSASMAGENFVSTGGVVSIRQRLFKRYHAMLAGGYEDAKYEGTQGQASSARHDKYFYLRPGVTFAVTKWVTFELYYQYSRNTSTFTLSEFDNNVAGIQASVAF